MSEKPLSLDVRRSAGVGSVTSAILNEAASTTRGDPDRPNPSLVVFEACQPPFNER
jgi:hypothetical protein